MKKNKITVHHGRGQADRAGQADASPQDGKPTELAAKHIIIATGARARDLPFAKADGKRIWTYRHAMVPPEMPTKLLVIGSGAIGIEFASFYNDMGAEVTVVEMLDRIVPVEDADVSRLPRKGADEAGHEDPDRRGRREARKRARTASRPRSRARTARSTQSEFSHVIVAIGIVPNTENIGLEELGVEADQAATSRSTAMAAPTSRASGRSATSPGRPGSRTRRATRASSPPRRSPAGNRPHPHAIDREHPGLHLLPPADRQRRPDRGQGQGSRATRSRPATSPSSATARRSRSARPRASSRRCSTPRPANCSARTWSAPKSPS